MKKTSHLWNYVLIGLVVYLIYQTTFTWYETGAVTEIKEDEVIFLTIDEKKYGINKSGFDSLTESLKIWDFDKKNEEVHLKFETLMPTDKTKIMILYDRGFDSFERHAEVLSISTFPYKYEMKKKSTLTVSHVDDDGTIYLDYKGKKIKLKKGRSYSTYSFSDFRLTKTTIKSHGIYKKEQFKKLESKE